MRTYPAVDAFRNLKGNRFGQWNEGMAAASSRIYGSTAVIDPSYDGPKIGLDSAVFAMGSCFARELEGHLISCGANVVSLDETIESPVFRDGAGVARNGFFNRFSPRAMWLEFKQAFDEAPNWDSDALLFRGGDDELWDFNYRPVPQLSYAEACTRERRTLAKHLVRRVAEARVVILTLGMTEAWWHRPSGLYANIIRPAYVMRHADEFELRVLDYGDVIECLEEIMDLLRRVHSTGDFEMFVTVSPVPLGKTFRATDIVVGNTESKAVLRSAAATFVDHHSNAHYFPSYEMAMYTAPENAWLPDRGHVRSELVEHIVRTFMEVVYVSEGQL